jgi:hypothetical protein
MTMRNAFFAYMALVGLVSGILIVATPQVTEFWIKPYFWVLLAVAVFDGAVLLGARSRPWTMMPMDVRVTGFIIGSVIMVMIPSLAGTPAKFF